MFTTAGGQGLDRTEGFAVEHVGAFPFGAEFAPAVIELIPKEADLRVLAVDDRLVEWPVGILSPACRFPLLACRGCPLGAVGRFGLRRLLEEDRPVPALAARAIQCAAVQPATHGI